MNDNNQEKQLARVDVNIERWGIFTTTHKTTKKSREITRETTFPNGEKATQKITIGKIDNNEVGVLGTGEAKIYYLANYLWDTQGKPINGKINFSVLDCLKELGLVSNPSVKEYNWFKSKTEKCRLIPIHFYNSYKNKNGDIESMETVITLFSDYSIFERRKDIKKGNPYFSFSSITLHPVIVKSLLEHNFKPIRFDVLKTLTHDVSVLLWRYLDIEMFNKLIYHKDLLDLAQEIGLSTTQRLSQLKCTIEKGLNELKGKDLTSGRIINAIIEPSKTPSKYKVLVIKGQQIISTNTGSNIPEKLESIDNDTWKYFHKLDKVEQETLEQQAKLEAEQNNWCQEADEDGRKLWIEGKLFELIEAYKLKRTKTKRKVKKIAKSLVKSDLQTIKISYNDHIASNVKIAGDFNNWQPEVMKKVNQNLWQKNLQLKVGQYKYKLIVDGRWISNPDGENVGDEFGNNIVKVG